MSWPGSSRPFGVTALPGCWPSRHPLASPRQSGLRWNWTVAMRQVAMFIPDQSRQQAVFDRLRQGILAGTLPSGARLPPTRALAEELGVARQTAVLAYERLASEGYVQARTGSGTYVAPDLPDAAPAPAVLPPVAASSLSVRGRRLATVPASAASSHTRLGALLAGGIPAPDLF